MLTKILLIFSILLTCHSLELASKEESAKESESMDKQEVNELNKWVALLEKGRENKDDEMINNLFEQLDCLKPDFIYALATHFEKLAEETLDESHLHRKGLALRLCLMAAEKNYTPAIGNLCELSRMLGFSGPDVIAWEKKGSELGVPHCMVLYGMRLLYGKEYDGITQQNEVEGMKWILIASDMQDEVALGMKEMLDEDLLEAQSLPSKEKEKYKTFLKQAKQKADQWKKEHPHLI